MKFQLLIFYMSPYRRVGAAVQWSSGSMAKRNRSIEYVVDYDRISKGNARVLVQFERSSRLVLLGLDLLFPC